MFDVAVFGSLFLTLFVIMSPPGITPIFLALTAGRPGRTQQVWHGGIRFLPGDGPAPGRHPVGTVLRFQAAPRAA